MATGSDMVPVFRSLIGKAYKSSYDGAILDSAGAIHYCVRKVFGNSIGVTIQALSNYFTGKTHIGTVVKHGPVEKTATKAGDIVICSKYDGTNSHVMMIAVNGTYNILEASATNGIRYKFDYSTMCNKATLWVRIDSGVTIKTSTAGSAVGSAGQSTPAAPSLSSSKNTIQYYSPYGKSLTKDQQKINALWIAAYLTTKGWKMGGICGLLGNMQAESSINPNRPENKYRETYPSKCNAFGLIQWTSARYKNLVKYCESRGITKFTATDDNPMGNMALQLDFLELDNGSDPVYGKNYYKSKNWKGGTYWTWAQFKQLPANLADEAAECFYYASERSAANDAGSRPNNAKSWAMYLAGLSEADFNVDLGGGGLGNSGEQYANVSSAAESQSAVGSDYAAVITGNLPLTSIDVYAGAMDAVLSKITESDNIGLSFTNIRAPIGYLRDLTHGGEFKFVIPESRTESFTAMYSTIDIPGRSSSLQAYNSSNAGPRNISLEIFAGEGLYTAKTCLDDIENDLRFLKSLVYPDYRGSIVNPPAVVLLYAGPNSVMKGVVTSVEVQKKAPFAPDGRAMSYSISFTVTQASDNPADFMDVRDGLSVAY